MTKLVNINGRLVNPDAVTFIIDREVHFNNGSRWVATEPEIQELLAIMFETPRVETMVLPEEVTKVIKKTITRKKK
jgi:hypothetical protein